LLFEGVSLEDVAVLLDAELDLVRQAQMVGLRELSRNLARTQGWAPTSPAIPSEEQHA